MFFYERLINQFFPPLIYPKNLISLICVLLKNWSSNVYSINTSEFAFFSAHDNLNIELQWHFRFISLLTVHRLHPYKEHKPHTKLDEWKCLLVLVVFLLSIKLLLHLMILFFTFVSHLPLDVTILPIYSKTLALYQQTNFQNCPAIKQKLPLPSGAWFIMAEEVRLLYKSSRHLSRIFNFTTNE